jgi:hypothetical protein
MSDVERPHGFDRCSPPVGARWEADDELAVLADFDGAACAEDARMRIADCMPGVYVARQSRNRMELTTRSSSARSSSVVPAR